MKCSILLLLTTLSANVWAMDAEPPRGDEPFNFSAFLGRNAHFVPTNIQEAITSVRDQFSDMGADDMLAAYKRLREASPNLPEMTEAKLQEIVQLGMNRFGRARHGVPARLFQVIRENARLLPPAQQDDVKEFLRLAASQAATADSDKLFDLYQEVRVKVPQLPDLTLEQLRRGIDLTQRDASDATINSLHSAYEQARDFTTNMPAVPEAVIENFEQRFRAALEAQDVPQLFGLYQEARAQMPQIPELTEEQFATFVAENNLENARSPLDLARPLMRFLQRNPEYINRATSGLHEAFDQAEQLGVPVDTARRFTQAVGLDKPTQDPEPTASKPMDPAKLDSILKKAERTVENLEAKVQVTVDKIKEKLEQRKKDTQQAAKAAEEIRQNALKDQNTQIWSIGDGHRYPKVGLYKRDLIEGAVFAANLVADKVLFEKLKEIRCQKIFDAMKAHPTEIERLVLFIADELKKIDTTYKQKTLWGRITSSTARDKAKLLELLKKFADLEHNNLSWNVLSENGFLSKKTVPLLAARLLFEKAGNWLEDQFIVKDYIPDAMQKPYKQDAEGKPAKLNKYSYWDQATGEYIRSDVPAVSLVTLAKLFIKPSALFKHLFVPRNGVPSTLQLTNRWLNLGLPQWMFNPKFQNVASFATEIFTLGVAAKLFDEACHAQWADYLVKNHNEFMLHIKRYQEALAMQDDAIIARAEKNLKEFIVKGHGSVSLLPLGQLRQWIYFRSSAAEYVGLAFGGTLLGFAGYKLYNIYQKMSKRAEQAPA